MFITAHWLNLDSRKAGLYLFGFWLTWSSAPCASSSVARPPSKIRGPSLSIIRFMQADEAMVDTINTRKLHKTFRSNKSLFYTKHESEISGRRGGLKFILCCFSGLTVNCCVHDNRNIFENDINRSYLNSPLDGVWDNSFNQSARYSGNSVHRLKCLEKKRQTG